MRRIAYAYPTRHDMAVLMVLFNPCGSVRIVQNWLYVWNKLKAAEIPVFGCELLFPWQRVGSLAPDVKTLTVRSESIMFHKEKLLERLAATVPAEFTKLCAIDCDVVFSRADWYDAVSVALDSADVVQPYASCYWMGPDMRLAIMKNPSAMYQLPVIRAAHATGTTDRLQGHPGFVMAMRRGIPQFPWAVVGGGDAVFFRAVNGLIGEFANPDMKALMVKAWETWSETMKDRGLTMAGVSGDIWHMWHGPLNGRQYYDRYVKFVEALKAAGIQDVGAVDIRDLLVENADGVWEWRADVRKSVNAMMLHYFSLRDDDSVEYNSVR
jgi:hypothetical protein